MQVFRRIKFLAAIFVKGHIITISAESFSIQTTGFAGEYVKSFLHRYIRETVYASWQPRFLTDKIRFSYFCGRSVIIFT